MSCIFQTLYFSEEGFVARCGSCGHFHVAFMSAMFIMPESAYHELYRITQYKMQEPDFAFAENSKSVMIPTHTKSAFIMLTRKELIEFAAMLDEADNEYKALTMINLFNKDKQSEE
ncbi:MAG: hypothetical protein EOP53_04105 [Sphingobacteriales bacterium]|nr:MAG: hypothetical protein EOP53_04105 [Sphingobacteriales bacterium]